MNSPAYVFVDRGDNIYIADQNNNRIQKFPPGSSSTTNGVTVASNQLNLPVSVFVDTTGNIYVADWNNERIQTFPSTSTSATNGVTVAGGNGSGNAANQFYGPAGVYVSNSTGNIYVADAYNNRIQEWPAYVYTPPTYPITTDPTLSGPICAGTTFYLPFTISTTFFAGLNIFTAQLSDATGSFTNPVNIGTLVDNVAGDLSVTIPPSTVFGTRYRIRVIGSAPYYGNGTGSDNGIDMTIYPVPPSPTLTLVGPGLGADSLVVTGEGSASQLLWYVGNALANTTIPYQSSIVAGGNGSGSYATFLNNPTGLYVDDNDNLYVADQGNNRIQYFPAGSSSSTAGVTVAGNQYGTASSPDHLNGPSDVFLDASGNIFVSDAGNNRIQKFPPNSTMGTNAVTVAGSGGGPSVLNGPSSLYVDGNDGVYVDDFYNNRVQYFAAGSNSGSTGVTVATGNGPYSVFVDSYGNLYTSIFGTNPRYWYVLEMGQGGGPTYTGSIIAGGNGSGISQNHFYGPGVVQTVGSIYVDASGNIYTTDCERILKFSPGGCYASSGVTVALNTGCHGTHTGIYLNSSGNIFVANADMNRIEKWSPCALKTAYTPTTIGSYTATYVASNGCVSQPSNVVTVNQTNGISLVTDNETISLYPNPNNGSFIIQSSSSIGREYSIYDMIGRNIAQGNISSNKQNITLKGISMGSYTLEVKGHKAIRFVINN